MEWLLLNFFADQMDAAGLPLPEGAYQWLENEDGPKGAHWIQEVRGLAALAQHHGVPTRLLDFTERGQVAAYFAALNPQPVTSPPAKKLCVWACRRDFLKLGDRTAGAWYKLLRAPRSSNPNLHAQSGVFVSWSIEGPMVSLLQLVQSVATGQLKLAGAPLKLAYPVVKRLTLPREQAKALLQLLRHEGVTTMSLFPGVDGVVRMVKEHVTEATKPQ